MPLYAQHLHLIQWSLCRSQLLMKGPINNERFNLGHNLSSRRIKLEGACSGLEMIELSKAHHMVAQGVLQVWGNLHLRVWRQCTVTQGFTQLGSKF